MDTKPLSVDAYLLQVLAVHVLLALSALRDFKQVVSEYFVFIVALDGSPKGCSAANSVSSRNGVTEHCPSHSQCMAS